MSQYQTKTKQLNLFPAIDIEPSYPEKPKVKIELTQEYIEKFSNYTLEAYIEDINALGLANIWNLICEYIKKYGENNEFLNISNFGELYEIGLAQQDKILKKNSGQYYTPDDVALVMSKWLDEIDGDSICDVACGTGKLILTYLDLIGKTKALNLINNGKIYLYDMDKTALDICKTAIMVKYSIKDETLIHDIHCDFLDADIQLPQNAKVISNPPYAAIKEIKDDWNFTKTLIETKELYSCFMEKIFQQAGASVVITPFSFISGNKFYSLRQEMCKIGNGFVVSFDNVPGNIFCGRKHGIFNTNTANSVRAAITVLNKSENIKGFKISPLIRFKNEERKKLLSNDILVNTLPEKLQIVTYNNPAFKKIDVELLPVFEKWEKESSYTLKDFISQDKNDFLIDIPNTCRYFTTASHRKLNRTGSISINIKDKRIFNFIYCFINSSFAYWWWRIYDGGITYPKNLLMDLPLPINLLTKDDDLFFEQYCNEMINQENNYITQKVNAGVPQENIKFPEKYREEINKKILSILNFDKNGNIFSKIHANSFINSNK
ncbi:N-6 DNA methylase [bacterium]|nr:N-6 DNA methylase [bacterium]